MFISKLHKLRHRQGKQFLQSHGKWQEQDDNTCSHFWCGLVCTSMYMCVSGIGQVFAYVEQASITLHCPLKERDYILGKEKRSSIHVLPLTPGADCKGVSQSQANTYLTPFQVAPHRSFILNPTSTPIEKNDSQNQKSHGQSDHPSHCQMGFAMGYRKDQHPKFTAASQMSLIWYTSELAFTSTNIHEH